MFHELIRGKKSHRLKAAVHTSYLDPSTPATIQFKSLAGLNSYQPFYPQLKLHTQFGRPGRCVHKPFLCFYMSHMHDEKGMSLDLGVSLLLLWFASVFL